MALTPTLEAEGWSRITFDEWGALSLDDFGELPLGTSPAFTPWHGTVIVGTLLSDDGLPVASDGWHAENIKIHIY